MLLHAHIRYRKDQTMNHSRQEKLNRNKSSILSKKDTITYRIFICFLITVVALIALVGYYAVNFRSLEIDELREGFIRDGNYVQVEVDRVMENMIDSARTVGYTTAVQKCLFSNNSSDKIQNITTSRELVATYRDNNKYIADLFYYADDGHLYSISSYYKEFRNLLDYYGEDRLLTLKQGFMSDIAIEENDACFLFYLLPIFRTASSIPHKNDRIGVCGILCNFTSILDDTDELIGDNRSCYVLYKDRILASSHALSDVGIEQLTDLSEDFGKNSILGQDFYTYSLRQGDWQITMLIDADEISFFNAGEHKQLYFLIVVCCIMFISMLLFISRRFSNEVSRMVSDLTSLQVGDADAIGPVRTKVSIPKGKELETIALEINSMIDRLEEASQKEKAAQDRVYSALMAQQAAEMTAYRSQINPHFFFNTLETIRSMSQYYHADMIEDIISAMSKMFRYSLYADTVVTLSREADMLEQFFLITSYRFPDRYALDVKLDDNVTDFPVPSMILQPIVENSIKHAFLDEDPSKKNLISVNAKLLDDGRLYVCIMDNGCGMSPDELAKLREKNTAPDTLERTRDSIGIHNIYERIKLFNKENEMEFSSELGSYTKVELRLYPTAQEYNRT